VVYFHHLTLILGVFSSLIVGFVFGFLVYFALPLVVDGSFWRGFDFGALVSSSLVLAGVATVFASFYSIAIGVTLHSLKGKSKELLESFFVILASIPTVVYAFLGVILVVPFVRDIGNCSGYSIVGAAFVLSFMITPTIVLFLKDSFNATPAIYKNIIYSLGGKKQDYELLVLLKYNKKAIFSAIILGFSRAIGDTMIALMVSGNAINYPTSATISIRTLSANIALLFGEDFNSVEFKTIFVSGLVLFIISFIVIVAIRRQSNE